MLQCNLELSYGKLRFLKFYGLVFPFGSRWRSGRPCGHHAFISVNCRSPCESLIFSTKSLGGVTLNVSIPTKKCKDAFGQKSQRKFPHMVWSILLKYWESITIINFAHIYLYLWRMICFPSMQVASPANLRTADADAIVSLQSMDLLLQNSLQSFLWQTEKQFVGGLTELSIFDASASYIARKLNNWSFVWCSFKAIPGQRCPRSNWLAKKVPTWRSENDF